MVEDRVTRLVVEAEVRRTLADYCQSCDDGRFELLRPGRRGDELVPCDGRWLIARREITLL